MTDPSPRSMSPPPVKKPSIGNTLTPSTTRSSSDDEPPETPPNTPLITQLYTEAAEFEKVLVRSGCIKSRCKSSCGSNGFADLVGQFLSKKEQAVANRAVQLSAGADSWFPDEQARYDGDDEGDDRSFSDSSDDKKEFGPPIIHRASGEKSSESLLKMEPSEIVDLIVEEFGALAAEGDEEKLILETDGSLVHDVAILGVIHLTTHRITFHASLLSMRPDLSPQEVIKSGPAVLHRKGWRSKRRVWMELTHDMVCAYASSSDEGRTRPLCAVLLTFVKHVLPYDPKHPRRIICVLSSGTVQSHDYIEYDTIESANDWRKELMGALFLFRHRRQEAYAAPDSDAGIRLSCPLDRIESIEPGSFPDFPSIVTLLVRIFESDLLPDESGIPLLQKFQLGTIRRIPAWNRLDEFISTAKRRSLNSSSNLQSPLVVDFGPLSFLETESKALGTDVENKDRAIRRTLGFSDDTELWIARARIYCTVTTSGYFVLSPHHIGFWSKNLTSSDIRYRLSLRTIKYAEPFHHNWLKIDGFSLGIEGQKDMKFVFKTEALRDEAVAKINALIMPNQITDSPISDLNMDIDSPLEENMTTNSSNTVSTLKRSATGIFSPLSRTLAAASLEAGKLPVNLQLKIPKVINLPREVLVSMKPLHFVCLTIGSRGDVQPYIALGLGLMKEGHKVTIVTHDEYKGWIEGFGMQHRQAGGDPGALMKLSVENKMFSPDFFRESLKNFRPWLDQLLVDAWEACKDADVLLESPSAMAGVHIAEALNIPYFRSFTMPWTKTTEFPHAFLSPPVESPTFNSASYILFSNVMWTATSGQINKWRRHTLNIASTDMGHLAQSKITFIYNFSQAVVPKPLDWPDTTIVSGYWFLDNPDLNWTPPKDLLAFMEKARADGKPIVYIGFGSITVPNPNRVTAKIVKAVLQSDVRAIISKGWSARMSKGSEKTPEVVMPPECYQLDKVPHDWLFPQIDAALHHGGAGTTGASLRAGIPTLIKPWFGDQFFWASRVQRLGAGLRVPSLRSSDLAEALTKATTSQSMREKAAIVGERIRAEDGVHTAIHTIYTYLPRASQKRTSLDKDK